MSNLIKVVWLVSCLLFVLVAHAQLSETAGLGEVGAQSLGESAISDLLAVSAKCKKGIIDTPAVGQEAVIQLLAPTCAVNCQFPGPNVTAADCVAECSQGQPCRACCIGIGGGTACTSQC